MQLKQRVLKLDAITILSALALIFLAVPLVRATASADVLTADGLRSATISGFGALRDSFFAYVLLAGPVLLILADNLPRLQTRQKALSLAVPAVCVAALLLLVFTGRSWIYGSNVTGAQITLAPAPGFYLLLLCYLAAAVSGAVRFHGLNGKSVEKLRDNGLAMLKNAKSSVADAVATGGAAVAEVKTSVETGAAKFVKSRGNLARANEILDLIERLAKMKDAGVLTPDEFQAKKTELLEEI